MTNGKLCFNFVMQHPVAFRDYFMPQVTGQFYRTRYYQMPIALAEDAVVPGGRRFGKSTDVDGSQLQTMINVPYKESLITTFRRTHLRDRMERIISALQKIAYFRSFLQQGSIHRSVKRDPVYEIRLLNGHIAWGISVGDDPQAANIVGKNPAFRKGDEFQFYPREAWKKLQSTKDPTGTIDRYYGTVDGRTDTPFRDLDTKASRFDGRRFHVSRRLEPHFTQEDKRELIETFGGEDSDKFKQEVDALWGSPTTGAWDLDAIGECMSSAVQTTWINVPYESVRGVRVDAVIPQLPSVSGDNTILGIDAGYVEPTVVLVLNNRAGKWRLVAGIYLMNRMIHDKQAEVIDYIASHYKADLAIDCSSGDGRAIADTLCNPEREMFAGKSYDSRITRVVFQAKIPIGVDEAGEEKEEDVKIHSTILLRRMFAAREIELPKNEDVALEFNKEAEVRKRDVVRVVTPNDVHIPEAFRCFAIRWFVRYGSGIPVEEATEFALPSIGEVDVRKGMFAKGRKRVRYG